MNGIHTVERGALSAPAGSLQYGQTFDASSVRLNVICIPLSLLQDPTISGGAKLLYGRIWLYAGKDGKCFASRETMASELGTSVATIRRWLSELVKALLIRRMRRGPNRAAGCEILWHPSLRGSLRNASPDGSKVNHQYNPYDGSEMTHQQPALMGQICNPDGSEMTRPDGSKLTHPYKEVKDSVEKIHLKESSIEEAADIAVEPIEPTIDPPRSNRSKVTQTLGWIPTPEEIEDIRSALAGHRATRTTAARTCCSLVEAGAIANRPDPEIARKVAARFADVGNLILWIEDLCSRFPGAKVQSYGFYVNDAATVWPGRREELARQAEALEAARQEAERQREAEMEWYRREKQADEERRRSEAMSRPAKCTVCNNVGHVAAWPTVAEMKTKPVLDHWCTCEHATRLKQEKGEGYLDSRNERAWEELRTCQQDERRRAQAVRWDGLYRRTSRQKLALIPGFKELERRFVFSSEEGEREAILADFSARIATIEQTCSFRDSVAA